MIKNFIESSSNSNVIYPYKNGAKIEFQENVAKCALKIVLQQQTNSISNKHYDELNFLYVSSAHFENDSISVIIEQFDKGEFSKLSNSLIPSSIFHDAIYVPSRLIHKPSMNINSLADPSCKTLMDDDTDTYKNGYYYNAIKYLLNYLMNSCTTIESINKTLLLSSTNYFSLNTDDNKTIILTTSFDLVTISNYFELNRIQPVVIVDTALYRSFQNQANVYLKPKTGYCVLYKNGNILIVHETDTKANSAPHIGIWVSGVTDFNHPFIWTACLRFAYSNLIPNKSDEYLNSFILVSFPSMNKRPEYYLCKPSASNLQFSLLNGSNIIVMDKMKNENRCVTVNLNQSKNLNDLQIFRNCLTQIFDHQNLLHQNSLLNSSNSMNNTQPHQRQLMPPPISLPPQSSYAIKSSSNDGNEWSDSNDELTKPRNINETLKLSTISNKLDKSSKLSNHDMMLSNHVVGSYHSVSDISVLSDNDDEPLSSSYFNNINSDYKASNNEFTKNYFNMSSSSASNQYSNNSNTNKKEYNQKLYCPDSYSSNTSNNMSKMSSNNKNFNGSDDQIHKQEQHQNFSQASVLQSILKKNIPNSIDSSNSKSMLFGIPRNAPKPTITSSSTEFDSPFSNITLNNLEEYVEPQQVEEEPSIIVENSNSYVPQSMSSSINSNNYAFANHIKSHTEPDLKKIEETRPSPTPSMIHHYANSMQPIQRNTPIMQQQLLPSLHSQSALIGQYHSHSPLNTTSSSSSSNSSLAHVTNQMNTSSSINNMQNNISNHSIPLKSPNFYMNTESNINNHINRNIYPQQTAPILNNSSNYNYSSKLTENITENTFNRSMEFKTTNNLGTTGSNAAIDHSASVLINHPSPLLIRNDTNSNNFFQQKEYVNGSHLNESSNSYARTSLDKTNVSVSSAKTDMTTLSNNSNNSQETYNSHRNDTPLILNKNKETISQITNRTVTPTIQQPYQQVQSLQPNLNIINEKFNNLALSNTISSDSTPFYQNQNKQLNININNNQIITSSNMISNNNISYYPQNYAQNFFNIEKVKNMVDHSTDNVKVISRDKEDNLANMNPFSNETSSSRVPSNYSNSNSISTTSSRQPINNYTIIEDGSVLPKLNYMSLLLDEYGDKNTSMNTEALVYKYLKGNGGMISEKSLINDPNNITNYEMSTYQQTLYCKENPFQFYAGKNFEMSNVTKYEPTGFKINEDINSKNNIINFKKESVQNAQQKNDDENDKSQDDDEDDDDDSDEDEIWLFRKPEKMNNKKFEKNFSDEDEPDRDVTKVLDIERLKKLPKFL